MPIDARTIPDMLHWYEGMLLMPEHFQSAHRRQELLSGYLSQIAAPHGWGVRSLETRIEKDLLQVIAVEAIMPDGLLVRYRADDPDEVPVEIDLKPYKAALDQQQKLTIHLIAMAWSDFALAHEGGEGAALVRYRSVRGTRLERDDPDAVAGGPAAEMMRERPWLRPILKLYVTDGPLKPPPPKYVSLPLVRLFQNAEAVITIDRYEPPQLRIGSAPEIAKCGREISAELRIKARFVNDRLQNDPGLPAQSGTDALPAIERQLRMLLRRFHTLKQNIDNLQALARSVPRVEALVANQDTHPFALYLALCDVVGDLALLDGKLNLPEIPPYEHTDPLISLDFLRQHVMMMLQTLNQRFRIIAFDRITEGRFELLAKPEDLGSKFVIGAVRAPGAPTSAVLDWMHNAAISSRGQTADVKIRREGGAARQHIERDETLDLVPPPLTTLFRVEAGEDRFDTADAVLVVENKASEGPLSLVLYAPREASDIVAAQSVP